MIRIVPSVAVAVIERIFPHLTEAHPVARQIGFDEGANVGAALAILDSVPVDLLPPIPEEQARYIAAIGRIRSTMVLWASGAHPGHLRALGTYPELNRQNPIDFCVALLRVARDRAPDPDVTGLEFIEHQEARYYLRIDISTAHRAIASGDFKSASVLAGSVMEALLLWAISTVDIQTRNDVVDAWRKEEPPNSKRAAGPPDRWGLFDYVEVSFRLNILGERARTAANLAREYRNLIHAGLVERTQARVTLGTALTAVGAMEEVVREVTAWVAAQR